MVAKIPPFSLLAKIAMPTCIVLIVGLFPSGAAELNPGDMLPSQWEPSERQQHFLRNGDNFDFTDGAAKRVPLATGRTGMVSGTTGSPAVHVGLKALQAGGTAMDAVLSTSLSQITMAGGAWVSFAGIMFGLYYDAESGEAHYFNAGYNTFLEEDDPLTIPGSADPIGGAPAPPSGRTAMVPGYLAGLEAAHQRFGKLPFAALLAPAIELAEKGYEIGPLFGGMIDGRRDVLSRRPETKAIFTKKDGSWYGEGDVFLQPTLAKTLRRVAEEGVQGYIYEGEWAEHFVKAVREDGGKATMADMRAYEVIWADPIRTIYREYELVFPGHPGQGGPALVEALNLIEIAGLNDSGRYTESADTLFWLLQIMNAFSLNYLDPDLLGTLFPGIDLSPESRTKRETAEALWPYIRDGKAVFGRPKAGSHSDAVVSVDQWGNVAALCHTTNTSTWGSTGINVDGISIPDSASFQQALIAATGPGKRLPDPTEFAIALKDGKPVLATSSIGAGLHSKTLCTLINTLDEGMNVKAAIDAPGIFLPGFTGGTTENRLPGGRFDEALLKQVRERGLSLKVLAPDDPAQRGARGYVVAIGIDPATGKLYGASPGEITGNSEGY